MSTLLLAPHSDDEALFAAFLVMRHQPDVVVCLGDPSPEIRELRERETTHALSHMGFRGNLWFWLHAEGEADRRALRQDLLDPLWSSYDRVFAPAVHPDGHPEHNLVGEVALDVYGSGQTTCYHTYTRLGGRTRDGREVPFHPGWIGPKLRALSVYQTQHVHPDRQPWFTSMIDLREWVA